MNKSRQIFFWALLIALPLAIAAIVLPSALQQVRIALQPAVVAYVATHLSEAEKQQMYRTLQDSVAGMFMEIPEPQVGRVAAPGFRGDFKEAAVSINASGMRSSKDITPKAADALRVICLGDSFVFGTGVPEETRFCNQMETFYREKNITVDGKRIETIAVGLPSYTAVQEASYLTARLSVYAPDIIMLVNVHNDIADSAGVTSFGGLTTEYSIERRELGGSVFTNQMGLPFGQTYYTALTTDLSPEARLRWDNAFAAIGRLGEVQTQRNGKLLLSVLQMPARHSRYFYELYKTRAIETGLPYLMVDYWQGKKTRLPHDGHPNAYGHELIAAQYIHTLSALGWIPVPAALLPQPEAFADDPVNPPVDAALLTSERTQFVAEHLSSRLDFTALSDDAYGAILGGIFPENSDDIALPWAGIRAAFLLKSPVVSNAHVSNATVSGATLKLIVQLPERGEMFPLPLSVSLNGVTVHQQTWEQADSGKRVTVSVPVSVPGDVIEVLLDTPRYTTDLLDNRMKSYRLVSAAIE